jgi:hypothetical protein
LASGSNRLAHMSLSLLYHAGVSVQPNSTPPGGIHVCALGHRVQGWARPPRRSSLPTWPASPR